MKKEDAEELGNGRKNEMNEEEENKDKGFMTQIKKSLHEIMKEYERENKRK